MNAWRTLKREGEQSKRQHNTENCVELRTPAEINKSYLAFEIDNLESCALGDLKSLTSPSSKESDTVITFLQEITRGVFEDKPSSVLVGLEPELLSYVTHFHVRFVSMKTLAFDQGCGGETG